MRQKRIPTLIVLGGLIGATAWGTASISGQDKGWSPIENFNTSRTTSHRMTLRERANYYETVQKTANMVNDRYARSLVSRTGLQLMNLTWEDTGRYKNSAVGPNISDMTIQVQLEDSRGNVTTKLMPVIRFPNFSDKTGDIDPSAFTLLVGNEDGKPLKRVSLYDFLNDPSRYLHDPDSWDVPTRSKSLLAERDSKVLVSAQACFLPVPITGKATFNPVLFNYQSVAGDPAVLTILATREGTSVTVIDNKRDAVRSNWMWGQRLFHNADGKRASLTGQRLAQFIADGRPIDNPGGVVASDAALNMVLLIQVPLKQKSPRRSGISVETLSGGQGGGGGTGGGGFGGSKSSGGSRRGGARSDVEASVIGHGDLEGKFTEIDGLKIERDPRYPIRVTVQYYLATSNGVVSDENIKQIKQDIDRVYDATENVGSLVTGGHTGRITEYDGIKVQSPQWWNDFWYRYERNTGYSRHGAILKLRNHFGVGYMNRPVCDLYLRDILR